MAPAQNTAERILEVARDLVQTRGYHAFSYRDVADHIGIRTASIHYHFPSKTDLIEAVLTRVGTEFDQALVQCDLAGGGAVDKLQRFTAIFFRSFGDGDRLCPYCVVACAQDSISETVTENVRAFWSRGEEWLTEVLREGKSAGELQFDAAVETVAKVMLATIEGAMISARIYQDRERMETAFEYLMKTICPTGRSSTAADASIYARSASGIIKEQLN